MSCAHLCNQVSLPEKGEFHVFSLFFIESEFKLTQLTNPSCPLSDPSKECTIPQPIELEVVLLQELLTLAATLGAASSLFLLLFLPLRRSALSFIKLPLL